MKQVLRLLGQWTGGAVVMLVLLFGYQALADGDIATDATKKWVPYKGTLEKDGIAYNGTINMRFDLYDESDAGTVAWSETQVVTVYNARFSVLLGSSSTASVASLTSLLSKGDDITISVTLDPAGDNVVLSNRQRFLPVPLSLWTASATDFKVGNTLTVLSEEPIAADGQTGPLVVQSAGATLAVAPDEVNATGTLNLNATSGNTVATGGDLDVGAALTIVDGFTSGGSGTINGLGLYIDSNGASTGGGAALVHDAGNVLRLDPNGDFAHVETGGFTTKGDTSIGGGTGQSHAVTGKMTFNQRTYHNGGANIGNSSSDPLTVAATAAFNSGVTLGNAASDTVTVKGTTTFQTATTFEQTVGFGPAVTGLSATWELTNCENVSVQDGLGGNDEGDFWCPSGKLVRGVRTKDIQGDGTETTHMINIRCCTLKITVK